jgi:general secretion pathway protein D
MILRKKTAFVFLSFFALHLVLPQTARADMADVMISKGLNEGLKKTIFLDLRDINVVDVLKFLALEGNINIVTSKNVQGRSTLLLRDVSIGDALEIIVVSNNLAYDIKGEIIYVMTEDEYFQLYGKNYNDKKRIFTRTLKYAKPSYVQTTLQTVQSALGKVIIDEDTGKVIMIDTQEKIDEMNALLDKLEERTDTKVVNLQYATAKDMEAELKARLEGKNVGTIFGDTRSNQMVVSAYPDRMQEILDLIKALDTKVKAVSVEARILQLTLNPTFDAGIDWQKTFSKSENEHARSLNFHNAFPIASTVSSASTLGSVGQIAFGNISDDEFSVELKAMKQIQHTKVLANPRLMILNRQEARINIGDKIPYVVTTTTGTGNNVSISEEIKFIDVGLLLVVKPVINDDGFITMSIRPEISSQTGTLTTPAGATIPQVNTTFLETTVVVKDGVSIIIGGLRRDDMTKTNKGLPYLMDVPILGQLFQSRDESIMKTEIVVFLTPKITDGSVDYTGQPLEIKRDIPGAVAASGVEAQAASPVMDKGTPLQIKRTKIPSRSAA